MVKLKIVVDAVAVHPVCSTRSVACSTHVIDVQASWVVRYGAVIVLRRVVILNEVVPCTPRPDDFSVAAPDRFHFDDVIGPNGALSAGAVACDVRVAAGLKRFFLTALLPCDHQDVAVGHGFDVVVRNMHDVVVRPRPLQVAVPRDSLKFTTGAASREIPGKIVCIVGCS